MTHTQELNRLPFMHPHLDKEEAEKLLSDSEDGSFLLRKSTTTQKDTVATISFACDLNWVQRRVWHIRIVKKARRLLLSHPTDFVSENYLPPNEKAYDCFADLLQDKVRRGLLVVVTLPNGMCVQQIVWLKYPISANEINCCLKPYTTD